MDLSKICINARQRNPWEAIDLGIVLTRLWWPKLFWVWFIPAAIIFTLATWLLGDYFWVAYFIVWWCKPLLDRGPLYIASRQLFGEALTLSAALRALPRVYKTDWFAWLTYRRLSFTRSFDMPLTVLEQMRGRDRAARINVLHRKYGSPAGWLTIVLIHIELLLIIGFSSLVVIMIPDNIEIDYMALFVDANGIAGWLNHGLSFIAMCLVAPFYAVCGFALYISRRVDLEAWDIEIHFRHLAAKHQAKHKYTAGVLSLAPLLLALGLMMTTPEPSYADQAVEVASPAVTDEATAPAAPAPELLATKEAITEVLARDEFHQYETVGRWRLKDQQTQKDDEIPEWLINLLQAFIEWLAGMDWEESTDTGTSLNPMFFIELLLWVLAIAVVAVVIYRYRQSIARLLRRTSTRPTIVQATPETLFGLDVRKDSLPSDVPLSVQQLWEAGHYREAVGLLYRSFLGTLLHDYGCRFSDSYTEGECVQVINALGQPELDRYALELTQIWQNLAYGHRTPDQQAVQALCVRWRELFQHG